MHKKEKGVFGINWVDEDATAWKVYKAEIISASQAQMTDKKSAHNLFQINLLTKVLRDLHVQDVLDPRTTSEL